MGSYGRLFVGNYQLAECKSEVDPTMILLFVEGDRRVTSFDPDGYVFYEFVGTEVDHDVDGEYFPEKFFRYEADLGAIKDRLEFMGFTLEGVRREFQAGLVERLEDLDSRISSYPALYEHDKLKRWYDLEREILETVTFEAWLEAFSSIIEGNMVRSHVYWNFEHPDHEALPPLVRFMLRGDLNASTWFPSYDFRALMRAAVEITGTDLKVVYDLTELIDSGNYEPDSDFCGWARRQMADDFVINHKVVVLTEGSTDRLAIEGALRLLYPHLADYYSFMDFSGARLQGGAGSLVGIIKAFVGTGIVNRTIALLDNDTAARDALRALRDVELPHNVRVIHYPDVEWARSYPTLGPQGLTEMDVNGLAGSIELYYGSDVLRGPDGSFTPIQWRGYVETLGQYQGQIMSKAAIQDKFSAKLAACLEDPSRTEGYDWTGLRAVLERMRTAFHS